MMHLSDELIEWVEPNAFDDAKCGCHQAAMSKLEKPDLNQMMSFLGADTIDQAVQHVGKLSKEEYLQYLSLYPAGE